METLAISALVGSFISFALDRVPAIKAWLGEIPVWADMLVFAVLFYGIPLAFVFAACQGYTLSLVPATCPADRDAVALLVANCTSAFLSSQAWHAYINPRLKTGNPGA